MTGPERNTWKVEYATVADAPSLLEVQYACFDSATFRKLFPATPLGREWLEPHYTRMANGAPNNKTPLVLVRDTNGTPIAFASYHVFAGGDSAEDRHWAKRWPSIEGFEEVVSYKALDDFYAPMAESHEALMGDRPHLFLEILGTRSEYRKKGLGSALVGWGAELADEMGLECYLDASTLGAPLYEQFGYVKQDTGVPGDHAVPMVRPAKVKVR